MVLDRPTVAKDLGEGLTARCERLRRDQSATARLADRSRRHVKAACDHRLAERQRPILDRRVGRRSRNGQRTRADEQPRCFSIEVGRSWVCHFIEKESDAQRAHIRLNPRALARQRRRKRLRLEQPIRRLLTPQVTFGREDELEEVAEPARRNTRRARERRRWPLVTVVHDRVKVLLVIGELELSQRLRTRTTTTPLAEQSSRATAERQRLEIFADVAARGARGARSASSRHHRAAATAVGGVRGALGRLLHHVVSE